MSPRQLGRACFVKFSRSISFERVIGCAKNHSIETPTAARTVIGASKRGTGPFDRRLMQTVATNVHGVGKPNVNLARAVAGMR
jgi:hypothetical protein